MTQRPEPPSRPLRILFVNENLGGHATVHHHLAQALAEGHPDVEATFFHLPHPGIARRVAGAQIPGLARLDLDLQPLRALLAQSAVTQRFLRRHAGRFDAIHVYTHNAALLSSRLLATRPTVVSLDTTNALNAYRLLHRAPTRWTPRLLPLLQAFERRVYDASTFIVANSEWAAASLREDYGIDAAKLRTFPLGIMPPVAAPPAGEAVGDLPRVTFVGRELARKGGLELLDGWRRRMRHKCVLALVTGDRVATEPGLEVMNDIRPGDGQIWEVLSASDIFVLPSPIDQAPNAVLEAMAMALPVVVSASGAAPEMVEDGLTGFVTAVGDYESVIEAILRLLGDDALRRRMGEAGRRRFYERYDARQTTAKLVETLRDAVGQRTVTRR